MAEQKKKMKRCPVSMQPDIENLLNDLSPDDFSKASKEEKDDFIQDRKSVSYWKDAWRRLKKNVVAMVALGVIVLLFLFAFLGPVLVPYGYDEFNKGAENLYPYHYTLEDQQKLDAEIASRTKTDVVDVDEMIAKAKEEAEAKGEKFTKKDEAVIRAQAKVAAKKGNSSGSDSEEEIDQDALRKELGIKKHLFGYSQKELERKASGEKVFPHVFGTDMYGRDILVRCMIGTRISMVVGLVSAVIVMIVGSIYGAISGLVGGKVDIVMMRIVDIIYSVPEILLIVVIKMVISEPLQSLIDTVPMFHGLQKIGSGLIAIFIVYGCLYWVGMARIVRGQILQLKTLDFVTAAEALGCGKATMIKEHLLPNCIGQLIATVMLQIPSAIFTEAFLSYLGIGVSAPMASLGSLTSEALNGITTYPYRVIFPALLISLIILSFNLFGDGLRDALDPKMKK